MNEFVNNFFDTVAFSSDCIIVSKMERYSKIFDGSYDSFFTISQKGNVIHKYGEADHQAISIISKNYMGDFPIIVAADQSLTRICKNVSRISNDNISFVGAVNYLFQNIYKPFVSGVFWNNNYFLYEIDRKNNYRHFLDTDILDNEFVVISTSSYKPRRSFHEPLCFRICETLNKGNPHYYAKKLKIYNDFIFDKEYKLNSALMSLDGKYIAISNGFKKPILLRDDQSFSSSEIL